jgi:dihydrofolate reductase
MRNVIVQEFVTLDGYAAGPSGELDFIAESTNVDSTAGDAVDAQLRFLETIDTILLGAVTYRMFAQYWPEQTTDTEAIADALNSTPKVVFSRTLEQAPWGAWGEATIVRASAADEVRRLKQDDGKDMVVWGSLALAASLMAEGLVDEYKLWLCPIVLGVGKRLFPEGLSPQSMTWLETKPYEGGVLSASFRPAGS